MIISCLKNQNIQITLLFIIKSEFCNSLTAPARGRGIATARRNADTACRVPT